MLTTPFEETEAYRLGIIDAQGKVLKKEKDLNTAEETDAYTLLNRMVFRLKRILNKVPFENKRFLSFAAALALVRENVYVEDDMLEEMLLVTMEEDSVKEEAVLLESNGFVSFKSFINEDGAVGGMIANVAGAGKIAGLGIGPEGEPGIKKKTKKRLFRRGD
jgi:hypothetical protein